MSRSSDSEYVQTPALMHPAQPPQITLENELQHMGAKDFDLLYFDDLLFDMVPMPTLNSGVLDSTYEK